jgi:predicted phosphodiesterase
MANKGLTDAQLTAAAEALRAHAGNINAAAKALGYPRPTFENHARTAIRKAFITQEELEALREQAKDAKRLPPERESLHSGRRLPQTADECWALLDDLIGRTSKANGPSAYIPGRQAKKAKQNDTRRIVVAGDFHAPFQDNHAVAELIRREKGADLLIINGDLQDFYAISRFLKYEPVSVESELAAVDALIGQLARAFPEVVIVAGNHDTQRFEKQLRSLLSPEMVHVIEFLTGGNLSAIRLIAKRYPNVRIAETQVGRHKLGWFWQEGDLLCTHAEQYSRLPGNTLRVIEEQMTDMEKVYGLKPWRVVIQAHTHAMGWFPFRAEKLLVEGGCMCATHGYMLTAGSRGRPQRRGYVVLEQRAGVTDLNSVRLVWLDPEREAVA